MIAHSQLSELNEFCAQVGSNPMLTQAAGGNVSVKVADQLWVKASGTWLSEALDRDIFVPVDLSLLRTQIERLDFETEPVIVGQSHLRPSIETLMHACLPQRYVVHLHAIEPLSILVRDEPEPELHDNLRGASFGWGYLPYAKPGGPLAERIATAIRAREDVEVLFLKNHGIVLGAETIARAMEIIQEISFMLAAATRVITSARDTEWDFNSNILGWHSPRDQELHRLAIDPRIFVRLKSDWALFPDHVVFLGETPAITTDPSSIDSYAADAQVVFIPGKGVLLRQGHKAGLEDQLRAYLEVLVRQRDSQPLSVLSKQQVHEILNWDAERYRIALQGSSQRT